MRYILLSVLALALAGCSIVYKLPTRQGNVLEQKQLDKLQVGMTKDQVRYLLGTPIAADPFRPERWDYFGYYKSPRGDITSRDVILYFDGDKLKDMDGVKIARDDSNIGQPDLDTLAKTAKKDVADKTRDQGYSKPGGVSVQP